MNLMPDTGLWVPPDLVEQERQEKARRLGVTALHAGEMDRIEALHTIAQKYNFVLACERCRQPFRGRNNPIDSTRSIFCGCRELRAGASPRA